MKKAVVTLLILWMGAGHGANSRLYAQRRPAPAHARRVAPPQPPRGDLFAKFPVGEPKSLDLEIDEDSFDGMSRGERLEQVRDWLLLTTVAESGASLDES